MQSAAKHTNKGLSRLPELRLHKITRMAEFFSSEAREHVENLCVPIQRSASHFAYVGLIGAGHLGPACLTVSYGGLMRWLWPLPNSK